jgi:hypothetical protein
VDLIADHIELAIAVVVAVSLTPMAFEILKHRRSKRRASAQS